MSLAWYVVCATLVVAACAILFGGEPVRLDSGKPNPLAHILLWTVVVVAVGALPFVLAVVRRPRVAANHYALTVRPGWVRSLVLPWARVAEVAVADEYLLIRCYTAAERPDVASMGNSVHWLDRSVLRAIAGQGSRVGRHFDLAVRLRDFAATDRAQLDLVALASFAPDHVLIAAPETGHVLGRKTVHPLAHRKEGLAAGRAPGRRKPAAGHASVPEKPAAGRREPNQVSGRDQRELGNDRPTAGQVRGSALPRTGHAEPETGPGQRDSGQALGHWKKA